MKCQTEIAELKIVIQGEVKVRPFSRVLFCILYASNIKSIIRKKQLMIDLMKLEKKKR